MQLSVRWELLSVLLVIVFSLSIWNILWIPWLAWVWQCSPDSSLACSNPPYLSLPNVRTILYGSLDVSFLLKLWFCLFPFMCGIHIWIHVCVWGMLTCVRRWRPDVHTEGLVWRSPSYVLRQELSLRLGPPFSLDLLTCGPPVSASPVLGLQKSATTPHLCMGAGDKSS